MNSLKKTEFIWEVNTLYIIISKKKNNNKTFILGYEIYNYGL